MTDTPWVWEHRHGPVEVLHDITPPTLPSPTAWLADVDEVALVLGSAQLLDDVDLGAAASRGVRVVSRRSGGGAVLLVPGEHVWIDVWLPSGSRWWIDDVVRATDWLADVWVTALEQCGLERLTVHRDAMVRSEWSSKVCFAGLGPGEVLADGRKLVGVSQRRTRDWARFQCVTHRRWDAAGTFTLLGATGAADAARSWQDRVAVIGDVDIVSAFARALDGI